MSEQIAAHPFRNWGAWAVLTGALALALVFAQMVGPSLQPGPSAATQIGEIAGEIKRSAWRSFFGLGNPKPEPEPVAIWTYFGLAGPILGVIAVILSLVSGVLRENWRYSVYGASLGAAAIMFQFVWYIALLIAGVLLLVAIIENIGEIFSF
ncbi:MAG: hypothetical protein HUJ24_09135 [Rhodobacteraceae bacterium]|nr:hypothetical protein [Paracoccaceae bacterium]